MATPLGSKTDSPQEPLIVNSYVGVRGWNPKLVPICYGMLKAPPLFFQELLLFLALLSCFASVRT